MSSMNSRFKSFGFGKRKSAASIQTPEGLTPSPTPPPGQIPQQPYHQHQHQQHIHQHPHPQQQPPPPSHTPAPSVGASVGASSSTASLPMNHPGPGNRPPSYSANFPPGQIPVGRTSPLVNQQNRTPPSQMVGGPPPINTGAPVGYPPGMAPMGQGPPQMGVPTGFQQQQPPPIQGYPPAGGPPPPQGGPIGQPYRPGANPAAEVEGASRSKAQLIVGIDFVRLRLLLCPPSVVLIST